MQRKIGGWLITHVIHIAVIWLIIGFGLFSTYWIWDWEVLTGFATWVLAGSIFLAIWQIIVTRESTTEQLKAATKSTNAQIAMDLFKELRDAKTIEMLRTIYDLPYDLSTAEGLKKLKNNEKKDIDYVLDRFDVLGVLVQKKIVNEELAIDVYAGTPSLRCWYRLHKYIKEVRDERGYFGVNIEDFAARSLEHFDKHKIKVKFYWMDDKKIHKVENLVKELQESEFPPQRRN